MSNETNCFLFTRKEREREGGVVGGKGGDKTWGVNHSRDPSRRKEQEIPVRKPVGKKKSLGLAENAQQVVFGGLLGCVLTCVVIPKFTTLSNTSCILFAPAFVGVEKKAELLIRISVIQTHTADLEAGAWRQRCPSSSQDPGKILATRKMWNPGLAQGQLDGRSGGLCLIDLFAYLESQVRALNFKMSQGKSSTLKKQKSNVSSLSLSQNN